MESRRPRKKPAKGPGPFAAGEPVCSPAFQARPCRKTSQRKEISNFMSSKKLKRFLSVVLSLSMALSVNLTGFAAEIAPDSPGVQVEADEDAAGAEDAAADGSLQEEEDLPAADEDACAEDGHVFEDGVSQEGEEPEAEEPEEPEAEEPEAEDEVFEAEAVQKEVFAAQEEGIAPQADTTTPPTTQTECTEESHIGYTVKVVRAATCTASGMGKRTCKCGKDSKFVSLTPRHTYQKIDTATGNPEVGEDGKMVPKDNADLSLNADYFIRATATCTSSGLTTYKCTRCKGTENVTTAPKKHSFEREEGWPDVKPAPTTPGIPSCGGEPAVNIWKCTEAGCDYTYEEVVPAVGSHSYTPVTIEATCETPRSTLEKCVTCEEVKPGAEPVPIEGEQARRRLGHSFEAHTTGGVVVEPGEGDTEPFVLSSTAEPAEGGKDVTCLEDGYQIYKCVDHEVSGEERKGCGFEYRVVIKARGSHEEKELMEYIPPTCTENAKYVTRCKYCNEVMGEEIDALDMYLAENDNDMEAAIAAAKNAGAYQLGHIWVENETPDIPVSCTEDGILTFTCDRCKKEETREVPARHEFEDENHNLKAGFEATEENKLVIYKAPTCTEDGVAYCTCSLCGVRRTDIVIPATGHDYGKVVTSYDNYKDGDDDGELTQAAVCKDGKVVYTCKNAVDEEGNTCGHSYTVDIPAKPHTPESSPKTTDATCTEPGRTATFCSVCKDPIGDVTIVKQKLGHTFETIDENGEVVKDENGDLVLGEHAGAPATIPATCMAEGSETYTCHRGDCGQTYVVKLAQEPHNMDLDTGTDDAPQDPIIPPTCQANAKIKQKCMNKDCTHTEEVDVTEVFSDEEITAMELWQRDGHELKLKAVYTEATCTKNGISLYACTMCDYTERRTIAAHHSYMEDGKLIPAEEYEAKYPDADGVSYLRVIKKADCENDGVALYTCANEGCAAGSEGHTYEGPIEKLGHEFDDGVVTLNPIECQPGTIKYTCQRTVDGGAKCGKEKTEELKETAKAHRYVTKSIAATCVEPAKSGKFCYWCDQIQPGTTPEVDKDSNPTGHSYIGTAEDGLALTDADGNTVYVKKELAEDTDYTEPKAATCTETGTRIYTCTHQGAGSKPCGAQVTLTAPALGHDWDTNPWVTTKANCTYPSRKEKACGNQGCKEKQRQIIGSKPAEGDAAHDWKVAEGDEDVKCGEVTFICQTNPEHTKTEEVHDWDEENPTATAHGGFEVIKCKGESCDATKIDDTGAQEGWKYCDVCKDGVQPAAYGGYDPTCEKAGKTDKEICTTCSKTFKEAEDIPATGHEYVREVTKEPSCVDGYSEEVCQNKGCESARNREPIAATGKHQFGEVDEKTGYAECSECHTKDVIADIRMEAVKEGTKNIIRLIADAKLVDEEKYEVLERGILYFTAKDGYPGELVIEDYGNNPKVHMEAIEQTDAIGGRLPINVGSSTDRVIYARAYVMLLNKETSKTEKRYSKTISGSFESLGGM